MGQVMISALEGIWLEGVVVLSFLSPKALHRPCAIPARGSFAWVILVSLIMHTTVTVRVVQATRATGCGRLSEPWECWHVQLFVCV